ncbi:MAG: hypothetical protein AAGE86_09380 [Pseudomonadota bacterium]
MNLEITLLIIGVLLLVGSIASYWKDTSKAVFPALLAVGGIFLCGAQTVRANIPGIGEIELLKSKAEQTSDTAVALAEASAANREAIDAINAELEVSRESFDQFRNQVNRRFQRLNQRPIALPQAQIQRIEQSQTLAQQRIEAARIANTEVQEKADSLRTLPELTTGD